MLKIFWVIMSKWKKIVIREKWVSSLKHDIEMHFLFIILKHVHIYIYIYINFFRTFEHLIENRQVNLPKYHSPILMKFCTFVFLLKILDT